MAKSNEFQQEISKLLKSTFILAYRLDDTSGNRGGTFQVSKKPFDFFGATQKGIFWGAESKRVKSERFPISNISPHQRQALIDLYNNNCLAWLFINWRTNNRTGKAIWIPFEDYCEIEYLAISDNRKSLKIYDFPEKWFLERISGGWKVPKEHPLSVYGINI